MQYRDPSALVAPIPLLPVAAGLTFTDDRFKADDLGGDKANTKKVGLTVQGSLPIGSFEPFFRGTYNLYSSMHTSGNDPDSGGYSSQSSTPGGQLAIGCRYTLVPLVSLEVEGNLGIEMQHVRSGSSNNGHLVDLGSPSDTTFNSRAVLVGVSVGV